MLIKRLYRWYVTIVMFFISNFIFAGDEGTTLKEGIGTLQGIMYVVSVPWCLIVIWHGVQAKKKGDSDAYNSMIAGLWIPASILIVGIIFTIMGMGDAVQATNFDFQ